MSWGLVQATVTNRMPSCPAFRFADRYLIRQKLGVGGMATVFLAEDLKHHRHVAMKVLQLDQLIAA